MFFNLESVIKENKLLLTKFNEQNINNNTYNSIIDIFRKMIVDGNNVHRTNVKIPSNNSGYVNLNHCGSGELSIDKKQNNTTDIDSTLFRNTHYVFSVFGSNYGDPGYGSNIYHLKESAHFYTVGDWLDLLPNEHISSWFDLPSSSKDAIYFSVIGEDNKENFLAIRMYMELLLTKFGGQMDKFYNIIILAENSCLKWNLYREIIGKNIQGHFLGKTHATLYQESKNTNNQ